MSTAATTATNTTTATTTSSTSSTTTDRRIPFPPHRPDGRTSHHTLRPLSCELSTLSQSDGSALWKSGATHVLASVHGPLAPRQPHWETDHTLVSLLIKSGGLGASSSLGEQHHREWEDVLTKVVTGCLEASSQRQRCVVQIVLQIISADGSVLAACLHAALSALMDAGLELSYLPTAVTCRIINGSTVSSSSSSSSSSSTSRCIQLDPTAEEEEDNDDDDNINNYGGGGTVVLFTNGSVDGDQETRTTTTSLHGTTILACHTSGNLHLTIPVLLQCCAAADQVRPALIAFWRLVMEQKVTREAQTLWSS